MILQQITVFLENRAGALFRVAELLANAGVDLRAVHIAETADYGLLRLIAADERAASKVLGENGFLFTVTEVVAAAVPDSPGGLTDILRYLAEQDIAVEYLYSAFGKSRDCAYMILRVAEPKLALNLFREHGLRPVDPTDLGLIIQ